jgi:hypothetical protein
VGKAVENSGHTYKKRAYGRMGKTGEGCYKMTPSCKISQVTGDIITKLPGNTNWRFNIINKKVHH